MSGPKDYFVVMGLDVAFNIEGYIAKPACSNGSDDLLYCAV